MIIVLTTTFTLVAFAANSLLCRTALGGHLIDPVSFTTLRLVSGAVALMPIARLLNEPEKTQKTGGSWISGFALFAYAAAFSLAYVSLSAGIGALILFGSVQITMVAAALKSGESFGPAQWLGSVVAMGGLITLVMPGISAPSPFGALLMCAAGIAWGMYSIRGKGVPAPIAMTTGNFARAAPMAVIASTVALSRAHLEPLGILLALVSGMVTSGFGYVLWYQALRSLTITQASIVQLIVPVLAAFGGIVFLAELISVRLIVATALILGGIALAVIKRRLKSDPLLGSDLGEPL